MSSPTEHTNRRSGAGLPTLVLLLGLGAWLWPIGFGGRMPVGGDATQFALGLFAGLREALRTGRLPLWNDLWGYGFPAVAESQIGAFYPPHWLLYGLLSLEGAFTASLVLHTFWAGLGAAWAARRWGVSPWGAALAGFTFAASGFFQVQLPHPWAVTVGSWMPWVLGLAWPLLDPCGPTRRWRTVATLAGLMAVQILPGHFQLAFYTQVSLVLLALWAAVDRPAEAPRRLRGPVWVAVALLTAVPLAAAQLWPTFQLARRAASGRDYEYLSGFASPPTHWVSYVAPDLFHRSPLWRPVAWDPFHTAPEEHLAYVGLVPLFLAVGAVVVGGRRDRRVRALVALVVASLFFSLGPYAPGFSAWSQAPGFSFFRAPARWSLVTALALAILAGKGFDSIPGWRRPGRALAGFAVLAALAPLMIVLLFELALASTEGRGIPWAARGFERAAGWLPWAHRPTFREWMALARQPQNDLRVQVALARQGRGPIPRAGLALRQERGAIYRRELGTTGALLLALVLASPLAGWRRGFPIVLFVLTVLDLGLLGQHRAYDLGPIRSVIGQSPVLARLAAEGRGTRIVAGLGNLPLVAQVGPISAYRTLDLPILGDLNDLAYAPLARLSGPTADTVAGAMRAAGARVRVIEPAAGAATLAGGSRPSRPRWVTIHDPALAGWIYSRAWVAQRGDAAATFVLWRPGDPTSRAWLVPWETGRPVPSEPRPPHAVMALLDAGAPLATHSPRPERMTIDVAADRPALVIVSQLDYPEWEAEWVGTDGSHRSAAIARAFGGWQAVRVPGPGRWTLHLAYRGHDVRVGIAVSAAAWLLVGLGTCFTGAWRRRGRTPGSVERGS